MMGARHHSPDYQMHVMQHVFMTEGVTKRHIDDAYALYLDLLRDGRFYDIEPGAAANMIIRRLPQ